MQRSAVQRSAVSWSRRGLYNGGGCTVYCRVTQTLCIWRTCVHVWRVWRVLLCVSCLLWCRNGVDALRVRVQCSHTNYGGKLMYVSALLCMSAIAALVPSRNGTSLGSWYFGTSLVCGIRSPPPPLPPPLPYLSATKSTRAGRRVNVPRSGRNYKSCSHRTQRTKHSLSQPT